MTNKFKVGDQIIAVSPPDGNRELVGSRGRVTAVATREIRRLPVCVDFHGYTWNCEAESLKLDKDYIDPRVGIIKK
jgi:hypothetical protein